MREQIEMLKHHADFATDGIDTFQIIRQLDAIDDDLALLMFFQTVDATDEGRFTGTGRSANHDLFSLLNAEIDTAQDMGFAEPFVETLDLDQSPGLRVIAQ